MAALFNPCQHCGGYRITIVSGEEMRVREIEVDE
jgi:Zn finger protein HypA/HybF involved in hydrogenase expression